MKKYVIAGARKGAKESTNYNINAYALTADEFIKMFGWINNSQDWPMYKGSMKNLTTDQILQIVDDKGKFFFENSEFFYVMKSI